MDDKPSAAELDEGREAVRARRRLAVRGAVVASSLFIGAALFRGQFDVWILVVAGLATATSWALVFGRDQVRDRPSLRPDPGTQRMAMADTLLANIPDPVILVDRRALVVEANAAARELLPNLKPRHPLSFALRSPDVLGGIEEVFRTGEPEKVEYSERVPTERTFEVQIGALRAPADGIDPQQNLVLFFRDLTSARRLEHTRVDFVANASHELRTPLASVLGFIETLQGPARNDVAARERFLEIMREQAQRMARLIDDLLSLSRIELREHVQPQTPVDVQPIVRHMIDTLGPLARERGAAIRVEAPDGPMMVRGDRDELLRVVENLIENAVKYGENGGRVDVRLGRLAPAPGQPAQIELSVRDYGPGIAPEHIPRLTERFYRVDVAASRERGGTGLGLAIVKHILNRHRGRIAIASELGKGAEFRVSIPEDLTEKPDAAPSERHATVMKAS